VTQPLGQAHVEGLADAGRAGRLAGVVHDVQAGLAGLREDGGERRGRMVLVAGQPDGDHAVVLAGQVERAPGPLDRAAARRVEDDLPVEAVAVAALGQPVEHGRERHAEVTEALAVRGRGERDLHVADALGHLVRTELDGDPVEVVGPPQALAYEVVLIEEVRERREPVRPATQMVGKIDAVARRDLGQRRPPHRTFQVHVQVRDGRQLGHGPGRLSRPAPVPPVIIAPVSGPGRAACWPTAGACAGFRAC
jgi:hypothetical protein